MPRFKRDLEMENEWGTHLTDREEARELRTEIHASDLLGCLRQTVISREYSSQFDVMTLLRFSFGHAFETALFKSVFTGESDGFVDSREALSRWDNSSEDLEDWLEAAVSKMNGGPTQELEVWKDGVVAHIDFGGDPYDFECKLTWVRPDDDVNSFLKKQWKWVEQIGTYTYMRDRLESRLAVMHVAPVPELRIYSLVWTPEELFDHWIRMMDRKQKVERHIQEGSLPGKTSQTKLCAGCSLKWICEDVKAKK